MAPRQKPGRSRQCYRTPPEFLRAVERAFAVERWCWDPYPKDLVLAVYGEVRGGISSWAWKRP